LPDGRHFAYLRNSPDATHRGIYIGSLDAKPEEQDRHRLLASEFRAVYAPSPDPAGGYLLCVRDDTLMAQSFDAASLKLAGEPMLVAEHVGEATNM
jgi:hypothetical protein